MPGSRPPQPISQGFTASFIYQETPGPGQFGIQSPADGIAFVLQNSGVSVLDGEGGLLGYGGITPSVAVELNVYHLNSGPGTVLNTQGATGLTAVLNGVGNTYNNTGPVSLASGDPIQVTVSFAAQTIGRKF